MGRPWRVEYPGAVYHVMARGNDRRDIFIDNDDWLMMTGLLKIAAGRFNLDLFAFCLMSNHYHLFLRTRDANLSRAMQWLNGTYTKRFHRAHRGGGHLLQGRYKAVLVADESHWLHLSMYIHLNPVRAGMVGDPAQWTWSSFREYTHKHRRLPWLKIDEPLSRFGPTDAARRRNYRRQAIALSGRPSSFWEDLRSAIFLGTDEQWESLRKDHAPRGDRLAVPDFSVAVRDEVDLDAEMARVAAAFGVDEEVLRTPRRRGNARIALYHHLVNACGLSPSHVAANLGVRPSAVTMGIKRLDQKLESDRILARKMERLSEK